MVVGSAEVMSWLGLAIWIALYNIPRLKGTPSSQAEQYKHKQASCLLARPSNIEFQHQAIEIIDKRILSFLDARAGMTYKT
mgnify:CR=1 FL=1